MCSAEDVKVSNQYRRFAPEITYRSNISYSRTNRSLSFEPSYH